MSTLVTTEPWDAAVLQAAITSAVLLGADLKMGIFTNTPTITKQSVIADLTEPTYAGYARQSLLMGDPIRDPVLGICALSGALVWQEAAAITPATIIGAFVTYGAGPLLLGAYVFDEPQNLVDAFSAFNTIFQYVQSSDNAGQVLVIV